MGNKCESQHINLNEEKNPVAFAATFIWETLTYGGDCLLKSHVNYKKQTILLLTCSVI